MRESSYLEGSDNLVSVLKQIPTFKPFEDDTIKKLLRLSRIRTYSPSEIIIAEGDQERGMYLLISGSVAITKNNKTLLTLKMTGDIFGEMSLLDEAPRSATVTAESDTSCLVIDTEYLEQIKAEGKDSFHAAIYHMFAQILANRLRITTEKYTHANLEIERLKSEIALLKQNLV